MLYLKKKRKIKEGSTTGSRFISGSIIHKRDLQIWIHIKMKQISNTVCIIEKVSIKGTHKLNSRGTENTFRAKKRLLSKGNLFHKAKKITFQKVTFFIRQNRLLFLYVDMFIVVVDVEQLVVVVDVEQLVVVLDVNVDVVVVVVVVFVVDV